MADLDVYHLLRFVQFNFNLFANFKLLLISNCYFKDQNMKLNLIFKSIQELYPCYRLKSKNVRIPSYKPI